MNTKRFPITLTFFTLTEFIAELQRRSLKTVRCEATTEDSGRGQLGPMRQFLVDLTAYDILTGEVLACSFLIGMCWVAFAEHESYHADNLDLAKTLVTEHLAESGFAVLSGRYHHEEDGRAVSGLWRFDEGKQLIREEG